MINVSSAWHRALWDDNRDYIEQVKITLEDETVLNLTNANIWGGVKIDDAVSSDSDFQIGAAIINKLSFNINNIYDDYNEYDFGNAEVEVKIGLVTDTNTEIIKKGKFIVNTATYNGSLINLECYDYMSKFEKPYSGSTLVYPATLDTIVRGACTDCGVTLGTLNFPHKTYTISAKPSDENATYREIIAWCAQIAGCFARCDVDGKLELKWYNQSAIGDGVSGLNGGIFDDDNPYASGDTADGGTFNPWNTGYEYDAGQFSASSGAHYINSLYSKNISVDDVVITGVRIIVKKDGTTTLDPTLVGTTGYVVEISNNPMITETNVSEIATWLGTQLIGFKFRKAQITHGSDPSIEAGDVAFIIDGKGNVYPIVISHTTFTVGSSQSTVSSAQTPARNSAQRYSNSTKNYVELRKSIQTEHNARQQAEQQLAQAIASAGGLYETTVVDQTTDATVYYLHNKPVLNESAIRIMFSDVGITVTADSGAHWYGLTASGDMITNLLSSTGINADWINTGQLVIKDSNNNETFFADADTGVVRVAPTVFTLTSANITTIQSEATSIANTAKADAISTAASDATSKANTAEQNAKDYSDGKLSAYQTIVSGIVDGLQDQIDGQIMSWYYDYEPTLNNVPANGWTTFDLKKEHEGDIFYWKSKGYAYRFLNDGTEQNPDWKWIQIQDTDISTAIGAAQNAQTTANSKRRIFTAQPTDADAYDVGDLWVNATYGTTYTNDILKCKTPKASGALFAISHWERASKYTDDTALNAFKNGDYATFVTSTNNAIGSKVTTFYQASSPTASVVGDLWIDTDDHNKLYRWNGTTWQDVRDTDIQAALTAAGDAQSTADSKIITFAQTTQPTATDVGDLWIDTDDNNKLYRWDGSQWSVVTDSSALTAFTNGTYANFVTATNQSLAKKVTTFYQSTTPTNAISGDLWIDDGNGNILKRYDGTSWVAVQDEGIQSALTAAGDAQSTADSKIITFAQASQPTATDIGDLWIDTDDNNKLYRWNGSTWSPMTDTSGLQSWITDTYASDKSDLQTQIDGKIQTWRQDEDPAVTEGWSDSATKAKHKGDIWYCTSEDIIPSWLSSYVNTESGMTALVSERADDVWFEISNAVNFSIDGATSTNIYIDTNSTFAFANTQPSTSGRNQAYNLNICRRDGQALSILNQLIEDGTHKAVKIKFSGYTEYSQSEQKTEYLNEYEVFFTNDNEIYINTIKQPTYAYSASAIDTSIKDSGTTVQFSLVADTHASIKKVDGSWVTKDDRFVDKSWMYEEDNGVYYWAEMSSGVPQELLDEVDGKSSIYTTASAPTDAQEGDLWFKSVSDPIKTYHNGQWVEYNKYTDDSTANANLVTAKSYSDTNLASAKSYADTKVSTYDTNLDQQAVFNKLTNNGQTQGIFLENNRIYINMTYASTGTLVVGGSSSNTDGEIEVKNSYGTRIGRIDKTGIYFGNISSNLNNPNFRLYDDGVLESRLGSSSYYAKMGSTYGFEVQGNGINAKMYASGWTYKRDDSSVPGTETPDYSETIDKETRPGYYGYNVAFKVSDSSYSSRGTYTAIGKNYIEIAYTSKALDLSDTYSYPSMCQLRSTNTDQTLLLVRYRGDYGYERSVELCETGFKKIRYYTSTYIPYTGSLVVGNVTYQVRGGIICKL